MQSITYQTLTDLARSCGLEVCGVASVDDLVTDREALDAWQGEGCFGEMRYMSREPELLTGPRKILPQAVTAILFSVRYSSAAHPAFRAGSGRVARYAWGRDYHQILRTSLESFVRATEKHLGTAVASRVFSDAVPLLERALAKRAGLGFIGKNTMLIQRGRGSHFFLAEVLWDVSVSGAPPDLGFNSKCGTCRRCGTSCPTGALDRDYRLDARRCISYLTIEKRSAFEAWERSAIGEWIFGCDICQDVCPFNHGAIRRSEAPDTDAFSRKSGVGPLLELKSVLGLRSTAEFRKRFEGTALLRARRETLLRNAACVAANTRAVEVLEALHDSVRHDPSAMVRQHALWACASIESSAERRSALLDRARKDDDAAVRAEAEAIRGDVGGSAGGD